jgi:hypothetical protein
MVVAKNICHELQFLPLVYPDSRCICHLHHKDPTRLKWKKSLVHTCKAPSPKSSKLIRHNFQGKQFFKSWSCENRYVIGSSVNLPKSGNWKRISYNSLSKTWFPTSCGQVSFPKNKATIWSIVVGFELSEGSIVSPLLVFQA